MRFAVWGDPVAHSRSPAMHGAALRAMGLHDVHAYEARRVTAGTDLARAFSELRAADGEVDARLRWGGVNITVPHKVAARAYLDSLDPLAAAIGAVNTVDVRPGGRLHGRNTDASGIVRGLGPETIRDAVVLGGGGAGRAVVFGLLQRDDPPLRSLWWITRTPERMGSSQIQDSRLHVAGWDAVPERVDADVWINATTVGMPGGPTEFPVPVPLRRLPDDARVVDIVIPTPESGLLGAADAAGLRTLDWRPMLLWQGVEALEGWLARELPIEAVDAMRDALG